jgi:hypothetical protein
MGRPRPRCETLSLPSRVCRMESRWASKGGRGSTGGGRCLQRRGKRGRQPGNIGGGPYPHAAGLCLGHRWCAAWRTDVQHTSLSCSPLRYCQQVSLRSIPLRYCQQVSLRSSPLRYRQQVFLRSSPLRHRQQVSLRSSPLRHCQQVSLRFSPLRYCRACPHAPLR